MKIFQTNFFGDYNLGLYGKASDKFCVLGVRDEKTREKIEELLEVKVYPLTIANTELAGIFCSLNSNGIILPKILREAELETFKKIKKDFGINVEIIKTKFTALGNLVFCNDKGGIISKIFSRKEKERIEDTLGVSCEYLSIRKINTVGSCAIATNKGCLVHRDAEENEIKVIEEVLKVKVDVGTANFGSPFVGSCGFANSKGCVIGNLTTGHEYVRISEALGFI